MTKSNSSQLEPFDPKIERTFRCLWNLVETRITPKKEKQEMDETLALGVANMEGVGNEAVAVAGVAGVKIIEGLWWNMPNPLLMELYLA